MALRAPKASKLRRLDTVFSNHGAKGSALVSMAYGRVQESVMTSVYDDM